MISLIIPTKSTNTKYKDYLVNNINKLYPENSNIEIIVEENDHVSLGVNYNNAVAKARGEKIILLHDDMVLKPGFIETMDAHIQPGKITTYTRVEPPIYKDTYPGKVLLDCGSDLESFNEKKFNEFYINEKTEPGGSQLFFGCYKSDYIGIDGYTFKMFCEDDDFHLRCKLLGLENIVSSAHVYHFVSKTSRTTQNYQQIEYNSNRNFIRKWGFRTSTYNKKYDKAFVVKNCNTLLLEALEPWCDAIYIQNSTQSLIDTYIQKEQENTKFDLNKRILNLEYSNPIDAHDIVVEFDGTKLSQETFNIIQNLSDIITESGEKGQFELDMFKITISNIQTHENKLINLL